MEEMKSELLSQISHEIRTPLNIILSSNTILKEEIKDNVSEEYRKFFDFISAAGNRLLRTFDIYIELSQVQMGNYKISPEVLNIKDLARSVYCEYKKACIEKGLELQIIEELSSSFILADEYSAQQIFRHLLDNAVKFTSKGSVKLVLHEDENYICADIEDTGIGMSSEYVARLFKLFSQEDTGYRRRYEGNGLGLALVKKYVEMNNALIDVKSIRNYGSSFNVKFKKNFRRRALLNDNKVA